MTSIVFSYASSASFFYFRLFILLSSVAFYYDPLQLKYSILQKYFTYKCG